MVPGQHHEEDDRGDGERKPAALHDPQRVGAEERGVHQQEQARRADGQPERVLPPVAKHLEREQRGDQHRARHRDPVSGCQRTRIAERDRDGRH